MSKICPKCKTVYDDDEMFCLEVGCGGSRLKECDDEKPALSLGDANAISGGVMINQSKNVTSHDVHYHTERNKSEKELTRDQQNRYHDAVAKLLKNGIITVEARAQLDKLRFLLDIDPKTALMIESAVKDEEKIQAKATNDGLSIIGKMALKSTIAAVESNSPQAANIIHKLAPICKTTMNEQVHFYYNMMLAAFEPQSCVDFYEKRTVDSYWQAFWASIAYRKLGNEVEAEAIISEMTYLWQDRPEINVVINACAGILIANNGNLDECKEQIIEYLTQSDEDPSRELHDMFHTILYQVGLEEEDSNKFAFYREHFFKSFIKEEQVEETSLTEDEAKTLYDAIDSDSDLDKIQNLQNAAEAGDVWGMFYYASLYHISNSVKKDYVLSVKFYTKAAELGNAPAMVNLGNCYFYGNGVIQNYEEAAKWYQKAADAGVAMAMNNLGNCYFYGNGVIQNYEVAVRWYQKAADAGNGYAMCALGNCNINGNGVAQDDDNAFQWFYKGAEAGDLTAMTNVGFCYEFGRGVKKNTIEAMSWYQKAIDNGCQMNEWLSQRMAECRRKANRKKANRDNVDADVVSKVKQQGDKAVSFQNADAIVKIVKAYGHNQSMNFSSICIYFVLKWKNCINRKIKMVSILYPQFPGETISQEVVLEFNNKGKLDMFIDDDADANGFVQYNTWDMKLSKSGVYSYKATLSVYDENNCLLSNYDLKLDVKYKRIFSGGIMRVVNI